MHARTPLRGLISTRNTVNARTAGSERGLSRTSSSVSRPAGANPRLGKLKDFSTNKSTQKLPHTYMYHFPKLDFRRGVSFILITFYYKLPTSKYIFFSKFVE